MSRSITRKPDRSENRITVILIRGLGGLKTYNMSLAWFRLAGAVVICLVLAVAALGWQNYTLRQDRQRLVGQLFLDSPVASRTGEAKTGPGGKEGSLENRSPIKSKAGEADSLKSAAGEKDRSGAKAPVPILAKSPDQPKSKKSEPDTRNQNQAATASDKGKEAGQSAPKKADREKTATTGASSPQTTIGQKTSADTGTEVAGKVSVPKAGQVKPGTSAASTAASAPVAVKPKPAQAAVKPVATSAKPAQKPETDAAKLAAAVAENLAEDRLSAEQMKLDGIKTMRLAQPKGIKISYKIKNLVGDGRRISGYAFMIGLGDDQQPVKAFPSEAVLNQGDPINFKQGRYFSIRQYTTIRGRIYTDENISFIKIMVYDLTGQLVMTKQFEAGNV